ncbi:YfcC family protein [Nocardioides sp. KC13]|uniref:YfcC family protein n=1 Tax=Nocardioides turkmenicus TaxID=2711220 RepID=A0A6M1R649_9ACTN|nr:YfcC family protein [Nocardioides sp. KC13]
MLTLLLGILVACAAMTYVIPTGSFRRDGDGTIIPGTYAAAPSSPTTLFELLTSLHTGLVESAPIIFGILITGGMLAVIDSRGVISGAVHLLAVRSGSNRYVVVSVVMLFFGVMSALGTITSEAMAFFPLGLVLARALRLSSLTGVMTILLPASIGYATSFLNPSSLALAQTIAGIPLFSGMPYRVVLFCVFQVVTMAFVLLRVRSEARQAETEPEAIDPTEIQSVAAPEAGGPFGVRHVLALVAFGLCLALFVAGTAMYAWSVAEMAACFVLATVLVAVIFRMPPTEVYEHFIEGMKSLVWVGVVIGVARSISVVLEAGGILDTIVQALGNLLISLPPTGGALALLGTGGAVNFFVGSGTGQAALTMPIIAPLTHVVGLTPQIGVLSFQLGDGVTNLLFPTSSMLMAGLAVAGVSYMRWLRETGWYLLTLAVLAIAAMVVSVLIGYN